VQQQQQQQQQQGVVVVVVVAWGVGVVRACMRRWLHGCRQML
jgi:hypothetical protein